MTTPNLKLSKRGERLYYRTVKCTQTIASRLHEKEQRWLNSISVFLDCPFEIHEAAEVWCCVVGTARNRLEELVDANLVKRNKINRKDGKVAYNYQIIID